MNTNCIVHKPKASEIGLALNPIDHQCYRVDIFCADCQMRVYSLTPREVLFEREHSQICASMFKLLNEWERGVK